MFYELWRSIRWDRCALQELEPSVSVISTSDFMSRFCSNLGEFRAMLSAMKHRSVKHANMHNVGGRGTELPVARSGPTCSTHRVSVRALATPSTQHAACCAMHGCMRRGLPSVSGRLLRQSCTAGLSIEVQKAATEVSEKAVDLGIVAGAMCCVVLWLCAA